MKSNYVSWNSEKQPEIAQISWLQVLERLQLVSSFQLQSRSGQQEGSAVQPLAFSSNKESENCVYSYVMFHWIWVCFCRIYHHVHLHNVLGSFTRASEGTGWDVYTYSKSIFRGDDRAEEPQSSSPSKPVLCLSNRQYLTLRASVIFAVSLSHCVP